MRDRPESGMLLAELVVWHTRPLAPTRRLALGNLVLPTDPPPGLGGLLLGAVVAEHARDVDDDLIPDLHRLIEQVERGDRVVQPRLRHRFQVDRHGLGHSTHRLYRRGRRPPVRLRPARVAVGDGARRRVRPRTTRGAQPAQHRAGLHKAVRWRGPIGPTLIAHLAGTNATSLSSLADPRAWALDVLGFPVGSPLPTRQGARRPVPRADAPRPPRPRGQRRRRVEGGARPR